MSNFQNTMKDSKEYIDMIIPDIENLLVKKSISFTTKASNEIMITEDRSKEEICSLIQTLPVPKSVLYLVLDVCKVKDKIFIRKKVK